MDLLEQARALQPELIALRRDFHRHPELSFQEHRTASVVADRLAALHLVVRTGVGRTGVVGELRNGSGPTVALRADMDALPIQEDPDHDFGSTEAGVMHACGHDAHTAGLLGAATLLVGAARGGHLAPGAVRFLFQPSEETVDSEGKSGATRMIEDGAMDDVDAIVGLHVGAHLPVGKVFLADGTIMAGGEEIVVDVHGRSAHGARPHEGVDAVLLASQGVLAAQQAVSRRIAPGDAGVITFGTVRGGTAANIIADHVRLTGTLRYFVEEVREELRAAVRAAFATAEALGGSARVTFRPGFPPVVNHAHVAARVGAAASGILGPDAVLPGSRIMEAEDFGILSREAPGAFFWLGAGLPDLRQHHHPRFDIDERALYVGAATLAASAQALLEDPPAHE
jgi:amidohydrolase